MITLGKQNEGSMGCRFGLLLFILGIWGNLFSQTTCCPYVDIIKVLPANPSSFDVIRIVTKTITPSLGNAIYYDFSRSADTLKLTSCFYAGGYTALQTYFDTTKVGMLEAGTYVVKYVGRISNSPGSCVIAANNTITTSFDVATVTDVSDTHLIADVEVFPNPFQDKIFIGGKINSTLHISFFDLLGSKVYEVSFGYRQELDVSFCSGGIYFYRISDGERVIKTGRIVKKL